MGLLTWLRSRKPGGTSQLNEWHRDWKDDCATPDSAAAAALTARLNSLALPEEEIEIEREMIAALEALLELQTSIAAQGLPIVETGHRVVGTDVCHLSVTASMPDDPAQPSGHLFYTRTRAIFAGGARSQTVPWHAVVEVLQQDRDVILVRNDRETFYRFRCNVFTDALTGAIHGRTLASQARSCRSV